MNSIVPEVLISAYLSEPTVLSTVPVAVVNVAEIVEGYLIIIIPSPPFPAVPEALLPELPPPPPCSSVPATPPLVEPLPSPPP